MKNLSILIVEDEREILDNRRAVLMGNFDGISVFTALVARDKSNNPEKFDFIGSVEDIQDYIREKSNFDIIISDLRMPNESEGLSVINAAKTCCTSTLFIIMTAHNEHGSMDKALDSGAHFYFDKKAYNADTNFKISIGNCIDLISTFKSRFGDTPRASELDNQIIQLLRMADTNEVDDSISELRNMFKQIPLRLRFQGIKQDDIDAIDLSDIEEKMEEVLHHFKKVRDSYKKHM